tara:strand:- start:865 stop:2262 length:1398 start_codon:yes stop_codon:yes gene_type:complete
MKKIDIGNKEVIHFIGIGGIGMSGLAQIMKMSGYKVQGSDVNINKNVENCKKIGIKFFLNHKKKNLKKVTIVVKSSAIKRDNLEIIEAKRIGIPIYDRAEMLANVIAFKKNIIVTGSHGKTTTTSLISKILSEANLDPTIINGGVINSLKNNAKFGNGEWAVIEADESDGSFLKLPINFSVITNLDHEHLDYYKNFKKLEESFLTFLNKTPVIGKAILCSDDLSIKKLIKRTTIKNYLTYGFKKNTDYQILNVKQIGVKSRFNIKLKYKGKINKVIKNINLNLLGHYNILNATAAISICLNLGINIKIIKNALNKFSGVERRMSNIFNKGNNNFFDDYAHHPTEISAVLSGIKNISKQRKILSIFQPHRYSRVKNLKKEFTKCFSKADIVLLCPVYSAGEKKDLSYDEYSFAKNIGKNSKVQVILIKEKNELFNYLKKNLVSDEIVIAMGAGSISQWMKELRNNL